MAGEAALALDGFDHRRFFTADIGAGPAAQLQRDMVGQSGGAHLVKLLTQKGDDFRIFIPHVDIAGLDPDDMGGDQDAFDHAVRVGAKIESVLEGAGLAFITVHRHQPRAGLATYNAPFAAGRETGAAKPAKRGGLKDTQSVLSAHFAGQKPPQRLVPAIGAVIVKQPRGCRQFHMPVPGHGRQVLAVGMRNKLVTDSRRRSLVAGTDAGRADKAHLVRIESLKLGKQIFTARHHAGQ